jgi:hypothetical protein
MPLTAAEKIVAAANCTEKIVPDTKRSKEEGSPISAEKIVAAANFSRENC